LTGRLKIALALTGYLGLLIGFLLVGGFAIYYDVGPDNQRHLNEMLAPRWQLLAGLCVLGLGVFGALFFAACQMYVIAPLKVVEGLRIILNANPSHRIAGAGPAEVRLLADSVNQLARRYETLEQDLEARIIAARASVVEEKNRLAALMSELSQGVIVCNIDGRILLYNERARQALGSGEAGGNGTASHIGLGRSIFAVVDRSLLVHALDSVRQRMTEDQPDLNVRLVTSTRTGQLMRVQLAPVLTPQPPTPPASTDAINDSGKQLPPLSRYTLMAVSGFVMTVDNITRDFERETRRDMLLQSLTEGSRASLANIRVAVETLLEYPDCDPPQRDQFLQIIGEEVRGLSGGVDKTMADYADSLKTRWPLEEMLGVDVVAAAQRRIESRLGLPTKVEVLDDSLWVKADSYTLIQALTYFAARLRDEYDVREVRFSLTRKGRLARLDLIWSGVVVSTQTLPAWEADPMHVGGEDSPLTLRDVMERHNAEIVFIVEKARHRSLFRFLLPLALPVPKTERPAGSYGVSRPEFYDFDLFNLAAYASELDERKLTDLAYTVFDTETTGLEPAQGDEIISIAAVRIVNNRLLRTESFAQLVDPRRLASWSSVSIHGLTHEMLVGQPTIDKVLPRFRDFCEDTVLVGHNAAFDMSFLQMKEEQTGIRFNQPVLDTLLLSSVLHPNQTSHALETIAERLGVPVVARHTALGDAIVTGEVFLRMIPLLAAQGIRTLREAREASEKTLYAKVEY